MALSRLRLRLAGWFALVYLAGLLVLSLALFGYMHHQSDRRFTRGLALSADQLLGAVRIEYQEVPGHHLEDAVASALDEWVPRPEAFGIYDGQGRLLAVTGPGEWSGALPTALRPDVVFPSERGGSGEHRVRLVEATSADPPVTIVAAGSTLVLDEDNESLALWLVVSTPLTALLGLAAGYVLSRRALRPIQGLEEAIGAIAPDSLAERLPIPEHPDELDRVALRFNDLLQRLEASQDDNRRFLEQAAHQIRTPLTLVLGETELALGRPRSPEAHTDALRRVRLAALQMRRRVEELMLLARAAAGERAALTDAVELDGLALECADLMRSRATALGRRLELSRVEPVSVRGSDELLREAVIELLENACRHGTEDAPVRLSAFPDGTMAVVEIDNHSVDGAVHHEQREGLGLAVVRWIAAEHGGDLQQWREDVRFVSRLALPPLPAEPSVAPASLSSR